MTKIREKEKYFKYLDALNEKALKNSNILGSTINERISNRFNIYTEQLYYVKSNLTDELYQHLSYGYIEIMDFNIIDIYMIVFLEGKLNKSREYNPPQNSNEQDRKNKNKIKKINDVKEWILSSPNEIIYELSYMNSTVLFLLQKYLNIRQFDSNTIEYIYSYFLDRKQRSDNRINKVIDKTIDKTIENLKSIKNPSDKIIRLKVENIFNKMFTYKV